MTWELHRHDARRVSEIIAPESVDLICCSPPYFALRSYRDNGEHYAEQLGSEATPGEFVDNLIACTADWLKVLKPTGSLFVNLGDKFSGSGGHNNAGVGAPAERGPLSYNKNAQVQAARRGIGDKAMREDDGLRRLAPAETGIPAKSRMGLPWRYAIRCIDELGLILRADIIWSKPNGLPESVTDRVRMSHEYLFHFVKSPRYFAAVDEVRQPTSDIGRKDKTVRAGPLVGNHGAMGHDGAGMRMTEVYNNPLGKVPSSVWSLQEGPGLVRVVLDAVADGYLTPHEGERLLWTASNSSSRTLNQSNRDAGNGAPTATVVDTADPSASTEAEVRNSPTASATGYSSDPSPTDSTSTTSVETRDASTPTISSPSPSRRTTDASKPPPTSPTVPEVTAWTMPTTTGRTEPPESVDSAPRTGFDVVTGGFVWQIPSEPLRVSDSLGVDHFAAFPSELVRRCVLGWTPSGWCSACGEARRPVVDKQLQHVNFTTHAKTRSSGGEARTGSDGNVSREHVTITGYACACPTTDAPTTPAVVLDPFCGTSTTVLVADQLGRHGVGVDLSSDYLRLGEWRIRYDTRTHRKVRERSGMPSPQPPTVNGQMDLFGEASA